MKKLTLIITLISASLFSATLDAGNKDRCAQNSWNPELYCFYGEKDNVIEKLGNIPVKLSEHRVFVQITEGDSKANIKLFEQEKDGKFTVTEWNTGSASDLLCEIDKAVIANKGVNCVGEQVKAILAKYLKNGEVKTGVPAPASPKAAFTHAVKEAAGEFVKSGVIILC